MIHYSGKSLDTIDMVMRMALSFLGMPPPQWLEVLSARPFASRCEPDVYGSLLVPFVGPLEGLLTAAAVLGLECAETVLTQEGAIRTLEVLPRRCDRPILIGPVDAYALWGRIEHKFHKGGAYFLYVLGREEDGFVVVHDPEGCPYFRCAPDRLVRALFQNGESRLIFLAMAAEAGSLAFIREKALRLFRDTRARAAGRKGALASLAKLVESSPLRGRFVKSLHLGLMQYGLDRLLCANFFHAASSLPGTQSDAEALRILADVQERARLKSFQALQGLRCGDARKVAVCLADLDGLEKRLDRYVVPAYHQDGQGCAVEG